MKTIERLLAEYKTRFRDTDRIKEEGYPFGNDDAINNGIYAIEFHVGVSPELIRNQNGLVYLEGKWATADLKEAPEGWVIEKDESHPMWGEFMEWYGEEDTAESYRYITEYNSAQDLAEYKDHQYLTLDQWAEFFLPKEKEIDFSILNTRIYWWPG